MLGNAIRMSRDKNNTQPSRARHFIIPIRAAEQLFAIDRSTRRDS